MAGNLETESKRANRHPIAKRQDAQPTTALFGYFIEVSKSNLSKVPADFTRKQTLVNAERFVTAELLQWEAELAEAEAQLQEADAERFSRLLQRYQRRGSAPATIRRGLGPTGCDGSLGRGRGRAWLHPTGTE